MDYPRAGTRQLTAGQGPVFAVRLTSDGKYCLTAGQDRTVRLWNPHKDAGTTKGLPLGLLVKSYAGPHGYEIRDVAPAPGNARFASCGGDKLVFVWDVMSGEVTRRLQGHDARVNCCSFAADGTVLLTGSYDRTVRCWDIRSRGTMPVQVLDNCRDSVTAVLASSAGDDIIASSVDGSVRVFDLRAARCHEDRLHAPVTSVTVSNDGNCLLATCLGGVVRLLEKASGAELSSYRGHKHASYPLESCFSNSDAHVLCGSEDGAICVWDLVDARLVRRLEHHSAAVGTLAYHPSERLLVSGSYDGTVVVWT